MLRLFPIALIISLALIACTHPQQATIPALPAPAKVEAPKAAPPPAERNFVCERVAEEGNPKAKCTPEETGPELHRARVTIDGQTISCVLPAGANEAVCGHLFYQPEQKTTDATDMNGKPAKSKAPPKK